MLAIDASRKMPLGTLSNVNNAVFYCCTALSVMSLFRPLSSHSAFGTSQGATEEYEGGSADFIHACSSFF